MALPIHTTLVTVSRSDQDGTIDALDTLTWSDVTTGLRAHIGSPSGIETVNGGSSTLRNARLNCDPFDLRHGDRVLDESTSIIYEVIWAAQRSAFGLDHTVADLLTVTDRAAV